MKWFHCSFSFLLYFQIWPGLIQQACVLSQWLVSCVCIIVTFRFDKFSRIGKQKWTDSTKCHGFVTVKVQLHQAFLFSLKKNVFYFSYCIIYILKGSKCQKQKPKGGFYIFVVLWNKLMHYIMKLWLFLAIIVPLKSLIDVFVFRANRNYCEGNQTTGCCLPPTIRWEYT